MNDYIKALDSAIAEIYAIAAEFDKMAEDSERITNLKGNDE